MGRVLTDILSRAERSERMRRVRSKDTKPEMTLRRLLHGMGYRYRLHRGDLPGSPDIVFPSRRAVIFVHGCFWHGHDCKRGARVPKTNADYWLAKVARNVERDRRTMASLDAAGWRSLVVWECRIKDRAALEVELVAFLDPPVRLEKAGDERAVA